MRIWLSTVFKGALMGAANVIPGVSGGTIALLTGIFEKLILAIRSFDINALTLLMKGSFREFSEYVQLSFLSAVGVGVVISIVSFAQLLEFLFNGYALYVWSFFFGLILASVWFVWKRIHCITMPVLVLFLFGAAFAVGVAWMEPAAENGSLPYLFICGVVAMCSMILPGLSGSYVLLLMGNYQLVMIDAVVNRNLATLLPVAAGAGVGLLVFSRLLAWVFKRFHDGTISLLTGFIFGSLSILWPWKEAIEQSFGEKIKVIGYSYFWPEPSRETLIALGLMIVGIILLTAIEKMAAQQN
jgi:putative membrane protein